MEQNDILACHVRRYNWHELIGKVEDAGFEIDYVSGFVSLLILAMYIQRKLVRTQENKVEEIHPNSFINKIFAGIMCIENVLLNMGIKFRFGGSLILVGHK